MRILVTGATGLIGCQAAAELVRSGHDVRLLVRDPAKVDRVFAPFGLRSEDFGLCVALQSICDQFRSPGVDLQPVCEACIDESKLPDIVRFTIYRVVQEALNNMAKHAAATEARVELKMKDETLRLVVRDNGVGFDPASVKDPADENSRGAGLRNMRERVLATGGEYTFESAPGEGVRILATWSQASLELLADETVLYGVDGNG